ncbi:MAG: DUF116 domain-containing protein [Candidatus Cloacimonetes bacterium]|nr:DUF116 domain-containing protein [Candidatus Cloacimonadota bacterium]
MKKYYYSIIKFPLFVSSSLFIMALLFFISALVSYSRLGLSAQETVIYTILFIFLVILVATWLLILISTHQKIKPRWIAKYAKWMLTFVYYNLAMFLSFITFREKQTIQESFINFNNEIVLSQSKGMKHKNILLLVPHCLQNSDCKVRVTTSIDNCESCGKCNIADIKRIAESFGVKAAVATGGSLARKIVEDSIPEVIVAVACHRDLTDGVRDSWRLPVYGVFNKRPKGPCFETTVSISNIEFAIKKFI